MGGKFVDNRTLEVWPELTVSPLLSVRICGVAVFGAKVGETASTMPLDPLFRAGTTNSSPVRLA